jgi:hypothetical protein
MQSTTTLEWPADVASAPLHRQDAPKLTPYERQPRTHYGETGTSPGEQRAHQRRGLYGDPPPAHYPFPTAWPGSGPNPPPMPAIPKDNPALKMKMTEIYGDSFLYGKVHPTLLAAVWWVCDILILGCLIFAAWYYFIRKKKPRLEEPLP